MNRHKGKEREIHNAHMYHAILPIIFVTIWILDTNIFKLTIWINNFIFLWLRIIFFIIFLIFALIFIQLSHKILFQQKHEPPNTLLTNGVLGYVRNPMYLGILLIYVALICLSVSIICIILFVFIFLVYNKMANFEEKKLEELIGDDFLKYKEKVPKWIPNLRRNI